MRLTLWDGIHSKCLFESSQIPLHFLIMTWFGMYTSTPFSTEFRVLIGIILGLQLIFKEFVSARSFEEHCLNWSENSRELKSKIVTHFFVSMARRKPCTDNFNRFTKRPMWRIILVFLIIFKIFDNAKALDKMTECSNLKCDKINGIFYRHLVWTVCTSNHWDFSLRISPCSR